MKILNGLELAGYIKQRHAHQVRRIINVGITPKLAILQSKNDPVINTYVRLKRRYGADINVAVDLYKQDQTKFPEKIAQLNSDDSIHGIIIQLPLANPTETDQIVNQVAPDKDVDALGHQASFEPATPMAIMWLLSGYNIELRGKKILLLGRGKLVGAPLEKLLKSSDLDVIVADRGDDLNLMLPEADVLITATSQPGLVKPNMIKKGAIVIDAGVASEEGKTVGDLAPEVYKRQDLTITPEKGGVGPLTVCALFENVINAAQSK